MLHNNHLEGVLAFKRTLLLASMILCLTKKIQSSSKKMESSKREQASRLKKKSNSGQQAVQKLKILMHASLPILIPLQGSNLAGQAKAERLQPYNHTVEVKNPCCLARKIAALLRLFWRSQRSLVRAFFRHPSSHNISTVKELA